MASIVKRKKKYSVVYTYTDENGNKRQKWETFETNAEAKKRKLQVEYEQESGTFIPPSAKTVNDLLDEYMSIYALTSEAFSAFISDNGIGEFYIAGADATACVKSTCFNMTKAGYTVHVISDCVTSYDLKKVDEMLDYYAKKGCEVKPLSEYMN